MCSMKLLSIYNLDSTLVIRSFYSSKLININLRISSSLSLNETNIIICNITQVLV